MSELPKGINARQLIKYAKDNGYNSTKFICRTPKGAFYGEFLDAYYEFIKIPIAGEGFTSLGDIEEEFGYDLMFDVIDDNEYETAVKFYSLLSGLK